MDSAPQEKTQQSFAVPPHLDMALFDDVLREFQAFRQTDDFYDRPTSKHLAKFVLDPTTLKNFFLWFVQQEQFIVRELESGRRPFHYQLPEGMSGMPSLRRFNHNAGKKFGTTSTHILHQDEYKVARKYLMSQPLLLETFLTIERGIGSYLSKLKKLLKDNDCLPVLIEDGKQKTIIDNIHFAGVATRTLIQEFLPAIALMSIGQKGEACHAKATQHAIGLCFRRAGFASMTNNGEEKICPFQNAIGHLMNMSFNVDSKGGLQIADTLQAGGLPNHISQILLKVMPHAYETAGISKSEFNR